MLLTAKVLGFLCPFNASQWMIHKRTKKDCVDAVKTMIWSRMAKTAAVERERARLVHIEANGRKRRHARIGKVEINLDMFHPEHKSRGWSIRVPFAQKRLGRFLGAKSVYPKSSASLPMPWACFEMQYSGKN